MKKIAPEKIYVEFRHPFGDEFTEMLGFEHRGNSDDIEYTRTDAFIEKACEFLDGVIYDYIELKHANVDTFMDVDNKRFIEDFKNYMEESKV